jgi:hypothetical protein
MARLYTRKQMNEVLKELRIKPVEDRVTSQEAAAILSWRAKQEHQTDYTYTDRSVRRHVTLGNLKDIKRVSTRQSLYAIEEVFELPLKPRHHGSEKQSSFSEITSPA